MCRVPGFVVHTSSIGHRSWSRDREERLDGLIDRAPGCALEPPRPHEEVRTAGSVEGGRDPYDGSQVSSVELRAPRSMPSTTGHLLTMSEAVRGGQPARTPQDRRSPGPLAQPPSEAMYARIAASSSSVIFA
jgi:hypothetical protein